VKILPILPMSNTTNKSIENHIKGKKRFILNTLYYSLYTLVVLVIFYFPSPAYAIEDPLNYPNNIFGVHILFPSEINAAAQLVNSNGGDYGYATIPIQSGDRDIKKWQDFMDTAKNLHLIPIVRLATEGDYFNTSVWRKPVFIDILDFANFLDSLNWPTKNRYIIIFNEPNRGNEWGGKPNPEEYADLLSYAVTAFKSKNPDFFVISAGMDNAAATSNVTDANTYSSINEYTFFTQMHQAVPGVFNQIDGMGSHSYPNPAFSQPPYLTSNESITSFRYESDLITSFSSKKLPIFITETGWSRDSVPDTVIGAYFQTAYATVWNDNRIVAVTPFLLQAVGKPFETFSLLKNNGADTPSSLSIKQIPKIKGMPILNKTVLAAETDIDAGMFPLRNFSGKHDSSVENQKHNELFLSSVKMLAKYLLHL